MKFGQWELSMCVADCKVRMRGRAYDSVCKDVIGDVLTLYAAGVLFI